MIELTIVFNGDDPERLLGVLEPLSPEIGTVALNAGYVMAAVSAREIGADNRIELTEDQLDVVCHALGETYLFDGFDGLIDCVGPAEAARIADTIIAVSGDDPRDETEGEESD